MDRPLEFSPEGARSSVLALALADWIRNELRPHTPRARELAEQMLRVLDLAAREADETNGFVAVTGVLRSGGRSVIAWEPGTSWRGRRIVRNTPVVRPRVLTPLLAAAIVLLVGAEPAFAGAANFTCRFGSLQIAADVHAGAGLLVSGSPTVERLRVPSYRSGGAGFTAVADRQRWDVWITGKPVGTSSSAKLVYRPRSGRRRQARGVCRIVSADHVLGLLESRFVRIRSAPHAGAAPLPRTAGAWPFVWATTRYRIDPASSHEWIHVEIVPIGAPSSVGWVARRDAGFVESTASDGTSLLPLLNASA